MQNESIRFTDRTNTPSEREKICNCMLPKFMSLSELIFFGVFYGFPVRQRRRQKQQRP